MDGRRYADDKPKDCRLCYFWHRVSKRCSLGEENCFYLLSIEDTRKKPVTVCDGCPYGRASPCIGWCTRKILGQLGGEEV